MASIPTDLTKAEIEEAQRMLWYKGNLQWKLDSTQLSIYEFIKKAPKKTVVLNCSRRLGKSYLLTIMAVEMCLKKPGAIVKFLQPKQNMIRKNIRPIMQKILADCPNDIKPEFKTQDNIYLFPNGSEIQLAGTDSGNAENIRGGDADLCLVDEAAFVLSELEYIVKSILIPTTTITRGKIVLSSTSPKEPDHDFKGYMEQAMLNNCFVKKTVFDARDDKSNPRITDEIVEEIINEYMGGVTNDNFRREYLCEIIADGDNAVVPEFNPELEEEVVCDWPAPIFRDRYVGMDIGFKDLTVVLFGYYDFDNGVVVIEDEIVMNGPQMTTSALAERIKDKERALWTDTMTGEHWTPHMRVSDNNLILLNDLHRDYGIVFMPTLKDNKEAAINNVRNMFLQHRIIINPRCKTLISHLKNATWNSKRTEYARSPDNGHYDAVDALVYLVRNIDFNRNPYPRGYRADGIGGPNSFFNPNINDGLQTEVQRSFAKMFERPSSLKRKKSNS